MVKVFINGMEDLSLRRSEFYGFKVWGVFDVKFDDLERSIKIRFRKKSHYNVFYREAKLDIWTEQELANGIKILDTDNDAASCNLIIKVFKNDTYPSKWDFEFHIERD